jgi:hypothetical protein
MLRIEIAELAVDLHERLIQMPTPVTIPTHVRGPPLSDLDSKWGTSNDSEKVYIEAVSGRFCVRPARPF